MPHLDTPSARPTGMRGGRRALPTAMKAITYSTYGGPDVLTLAEFEDPKVGPGEILLDVRAAGVNPVDWKVMSGGLDPMLETRFPAIPGWDVAGVVDAVGPDTPEFVAGDRVAAYARKQVVSAGTFAEYVTVPHENVWVHEHDGGQELISPELGAAFDPLGNAVHTALKFPLVGEDVLITGAGPIGQMAAAVARHAGARYITITDISPERLAMAEDCGADVVLDVSTTRVLDAQRQLGMREGFDVGLEITGQARALQEMIENMNHGGKISLLGLPSRQFEIDWTMVVTRMLTLQGIYGREMYETWNAMSAMLSTSRTLRTAIERTITHVLPAADWEEGFALAREGKAGKVLLDWSDVGD